MFGNFLKKASELFRIIVLTPLSEDKNFTSQFQKYNITTEKLLERKNTKKWKRIISFRNSLHDKYHFNETRELKFKKSLSKYKKSKFKALLIHKFLRLITTQSLLKRFDKLESGVSTKSEEANYYKELFKKHSPDIIYSPAPLMIEEWLPVQIAAAMGIKTVLSVLSWDNLSSKSRLPLPVDNIFVWSDRMKSELLTYYPSVSKDKILVTGTPQFDSYFDENNYISREDFFKSKGLDTTKKLIVYAGVTPGLMPDEQNIVEELIQSIEKNEINAPVQLLVRLHPKDGGERYREIIEKYPDVRFEIQGNKNKGNIKTWSPTSDTVINLVNTIRHGDVHINVASTMTIDAAFFDKPVINIRYTKGKTPVEAVWGLKIYETTHYKPIVQTGGVKISHSNSDTIKFINEYLKNPEELSTERRKIIDLIFTKPDGNSGIKIAEKLFQICKNNINV